MHEQKSNNNGLPIEKEYPPFARQDPILRDKARKWARQNRRLILVDLGMGAGYLAAWLLTGWSIRLRDVLAKMITLDWLLLLVFAAVLGLVYFLIGAPLSFYRDFILPHRFGQSNETLRNWILDQLKGLAVSAVLGGLLLEILYAMLRFAPENWFLWAAGFMLVVNVLMANLAPVLLFPIFNKFTPLDDDNQDLQNRLLTLAETTGIRVARVYKFDMSRRTKSANAALTGLGNTRRIILGDTLINSFSIDEIETILAHELGHQANKDIPFGILFETIVTVTGLFIAALAMKNGVNYFGFQGISDPAAMPLLALILGIFGLVITPATNTFLRWRERRADAYAIRVTGKPAAFASAMMRLADQNLADSDPERWVEICLYSHPAINRRIAMAANYKGN
jgi:STE24 endopeptidase